MSLLHREKGTLYEANSCTSKFNDFQVQYHTVYHVRVPLFYSFLQRMYQILLFQRMKQKQLQ